VLESSAQPVLFMASRTRPVSQVSTHYKMVQLQLPCCCETWLEQRYMNNR
jgi:hypothetical protein